MVTIGQIAAYAGVTVRAVRHYHRCGLLAEPPRDPSGYRRYGAEHATALVKIRTLAGAGVPLKRVEELLSAEPEQFARAVDEIDRTLQHRIEDLQRTRRRIAQLGAGHRLFVSADVAEYLELLHDLGASERMVRMERDIWILLHSASPEAAAALVADKRDAIDDPEFRALYLDYDAAFDRPPDDPGLPALAARVRRWVAERRRQRRPEAEPVAAHLVASSAGASSPAWERITELAARPDQTGAAQSDRKAAPSSATATSASASRPAKTR